MNTVLMLALFLVLLALTAFFNLAEMALVAARASALHGAENSGAAGKVLDLKKRPGLFLAAIRAGDLVTDLLTGAFIVSWIEALIGTGLGVLPVIGGYASAIAGFCAFAVVSYLILVFGDLAPKSIALSAPERSAMLIASPLRLLIVVARPFLAALEGSNALVLKILGVKPQSGERITQQEIRRVLSEGLSAGALMSFERSMMERVLDLDHRSVRTVMTGRRYIDVLATDMDEDKLREAVLGAKASRLLVAEDGDLDKLVGIVSRADVLEAVAGDVTRPQSAAMEKEASHFRPQPDGSCIVSGNLPVDDVAETIPFTTPIDRGYKTMAGLVIDRLRRIPCEGETVDLPTLTIEIVSVQQGIVTSMRLIPK